MYCTVPAGLLLCLVRVKGGRQWIRSDLSWTDHTSSDDKETTRKNFTASWRTDENFHCHGHDDDDDDDVDDDDDDDGGGGGGGFIYIYIVYITLYWYHSHHCDGVASNNMYIFWI